ncbi:hypothetical protein GCM10022245_55240 [Streptomyces mayteni]
MVDAVDRAIGRVSEALYRGRDGRAVRQTTPTEVIARHLRVLDVRPGQRVLEIGTGSGYSAAVLAEAVGPTGHVVSVDVVPELVERAATIHRDGFRPNITSVVGDGLVGWSEGAPFDRVVAWTQPPLLPEAWLTQTRIGGVVLAPVPCAPIAYSTVMARIEVGDDHSPVAVTPHRGQYVPMRTPGNRRRELVVAYRRPGGGGECYLSAPWLRGSKEPGLADAVLGRALAAEYSEPLEEGWPEVEHLKIWLMASEVERLSVAGLGRETAIGITTADDLALAVLFPEPRLLAESADSAALKELREWIGRWRDAGRPRIDRLRAWCEPVEGGWYLRTTRTWVSTAPESAGDVSAPAEASGA